MQPIKNSNLNRGWQRVTDLRGFAAQHGCFTLSLFLMLIAKARCKQSANPGKHAETP